MTYTRQTLREAVQSALRDFDDCGPELSAAYADAAIAAMLEALREPSEAWITTVAKAISATDGVPDHAPPGHYLRNAKAAFKAILDAFEKERSDGQ